MKLQKLTIDFIHKASITHDNCYAYDESKYVDANTKICIICKEHGRFWQLPRKHISGQGCPKCGRKSRTKFTIGDFILRANAVHGQKYAYLKSVYVNANEHIIITCPDHGDFKQRPMAHLLGHGCRACNSKRKETTKSKRDFKEEFIKNAKLIHGDKYGYDCSEYIKSDVPVKILCKKCNRTFNKRPIEHIKRNSGCPICERQNKSEANRRSDFIPASIAVHGNKYSYELVDYVNKDTKVEILCSEHGPFKQAPHHHLRGQGCPKCHCSSEQLKVSKFISSLNIAHTLNDRNVIKPFEIDILIDKKLAIEIDGIYWHSIRLDARAHLSKKTKMCNEAKLPLLQFWDTDVNDKWHIVQSMIKNKLGMCSVIYGRKCVVKEIPGKVCDDFMSQNHLSGHRRASTNIGLYHGDDLVSAMSFSRHNKYGWEVMRLASLCGYNVVGGASKLFKYFIRTRHPDTVMTYANRRTSVGDIYYKLGFKLDATIRPGYSYFKNGKLYSRQRFQKSKLHTLQVFDKKASESVNMAKNGYRRIWDSGHFRFLWH